MDDAQERRLREIVRDSAAVEGTFEYAYRCDGLDDFFVTGGAGNPLRLWWTCNPYGRTSPRYNCFLVRVITAQGAEAYAALADAIERFVSQKATNCDTRKEPVA